MPAFSFRFKLLLAMMLVVSGITGATIYLAQKKLEAAYETVFQKEFESEVALFTQGQEARLGAIKERCRRLVGSVRFISVMGELEEEISDEKLEILYDLAKDELRIQGGTRGAAAFYRFMNRKGEVLPNPSLPVERNKVIMERIQPASVTLNNSDQEVGYLPLAETDGSNILQETLITKIVDPENNEVVGALIMGFPFEEKNQGGKKVDFDSGLVVEGEVYSMGITGAARTQVIELVRRTEAEMAHYEAELNGEPHSVYVRSLDADSHLPQTRHVVIHSMAESLQQQMELRVMVLGLGAAAMAVALLLSLLLSHGLTGPVQELVKGTKEIREGNYAVTVPVRSRDEIGVLAESFNEMATGLALKEKYRSVLDIVADKGIAEELLSGKIKLGGEERLVSVLFCDIRGFTALTEKMEPPEIIQMLNEHFTPLTKVVYEHHGVVDKFVGDLIMAIFGAPKSAGNDAANAVNCALAMIRERTELSLNSKYKIRMGIGIATGRAVAGRMGSSDRMNYTVLGPKVNLAARLCSQAGLMEVVVDEETREALHDTVHAEPMPEMKLKGFAQMIKAWKLTPLSQT